MKLIWQIVFSVYIGVALVSTIFTLSPWVMLSTVPLCAVWVFIGRFAPEKEKAVDTTKAFVDLAASIHKVTSRIENLEIKSGFSSRIPGMSGDRHG